MKLKAIIKWRR